MPTDSDSAASCSTRYPLRLRHPGGAAQDWPPLLVTPPPCIAMRLSSASAQSLVFSLVVCPSSAFAPLSLSPGGGIAFSKTSSPARRQSGSCKAPSSCQAPTTRWRGHGTGVVVHAKPPQPRKGEREEDFDDDLGGPTIGRPGMQDRGGVRVRRRMDKSRAVPTDQQPFNELQELKEDPLFGWAQEDLKGLVLRLGLVYVGALAISIPIGTTTFPHQLPEALLSANVGALGVLLAVVVRLYSGWNYVSIRLGAEVVEYEESGWYDGSEWFKPPDIRARDEMLNNYEVQPAVDRLKVMLAAIGVGFLLTVAGFKAVVPEDPYAMLDDTYLNTLRNDDDVANDAARKAAAKGTNRPVFCESRYYQAMAGGGLCDK